MAIKYTEEQLNTVDKSLLIQMFLNLQEEIIRSNDQVDLTTLGSDPCAHKLPSVYGLLCEGSPHF